MTDRLINLRDWEAAALAEGRATALVRVCKPQPVVRNVGGVAHMWTFAKPDSTGHWIWPNASEQIIAASPFGAPGDAILGRESYLIEAHPADYGMTRDDLPHTWDAAVAAAGAVYYKADPLGIVRADGRAWRSPVTMPRHAIRARYTNSGVQCMRVHELTEQDARDLGFFAYSWADDNISSRIQYAEQFTQDHGPGAWSANPWVFIARLTK